MISSVAKRLVVVALVGLACTCGGGSQSTVGGSSGPRPVPPPPTTTEPAKPIVQTPRAIAEPKLFAQALPNDPTKTTIHRLSNGMTVYISPDPKQPTIVAQIAVRAGGAQDPQSSTGLAHYLEHMLFKGTSELGTLDYAKEKTHLDKIATLYAELRKPGVERDRVLKEIDSETQKSAAYAVPNELDQLYARMGIVGLNAFTTSDATVYVSEIPKNRIAQWARVESHRYADAVFRLFWPELEAVYEEKNRGIDSPQRRAHEAFMKAMFPKHGYGWSSVLGEIEHLKSPAYQDMEAFFRRYYTPANMAILLAGDVDASVLPLLEKEFGQFKRPAGEATPAAELPKPAGRVEVNVPVPADEGVVLGWQLVGATHPDRLALEVMDLLLLDGQSGILARDLLLTQKVADAGCNPTFMRDSGYYELNADALAGQTHAELEKLLLGLADKLKKGDFTDQDLATAILTSEIRQQLQLESNAGRMAIMVDAFTLGEEWPDVVTKLDRMKKITKADIMRVANQYLDGNYLVVKKVKGKAEQPKIAKPGITAVKVDPSRQSAFAKSVLEMPVTPIEPEVLVEGKDYERGKLPTGELVSVKNDRNGLFSITYEYDYGRADDRLACLALETLSVSGAGKQTAEQVARKLHELGLAVDVACSKSESAISISGIDRNLDAGIALLREWLAAPAIDDATLQKKVAAVLTERQNAIASPQSVMGALQLYARFGAESEFLVVPSNKQLQAAKPAQLAKLLGKYLKLTHRTSYFGPRGGKEAAAAIVLGDGSIKTKPPRPVRFRKPNAVIGTDQEMAQTHVWMMWPRPSATADDRAAGTVFSEYAAAMLYQEVREARGLAYTVFGGFDPGAKKTDDADVYVYAGTQGDKTDDAITAILTSLRAPIDDKRLDTAKETLVQNYRADRIPPRGIAGTVYAWQDQGETADPRAGRMKRASAVDKAMLEKWMKAALGRPVLISVVGERKKLDEAKLKQLAPVTFVPVNKLFGY
ncbi:MAG TPA: insulinase family protein [Kofleriaceae bacterium]|nr:insulinase family protein [Kofleriaceae bacterium]